MSMNGMAFACTAAPLLVPYVMELAYVLDATMEWEIGQDVMDVLSALP